MNLSTVTSWRKFMIYTTMIIISTLTCKTKGDGGRLQISREPKDTFYCGAGGLCEYEDFFQNPLQTREFCSDRNARCTESTCRKCKCKDGYQNFISYTYGCLEFKKAKHFLSRGMLL